MAIYWQFKQKQKAFPIFFVCFNTVSTAVELDKWNVNLCATHHGSLAP